MKFIARIKGQDGYHEEDLDMDLSDGPAAFLVNAVTMAEEIALQIYGERAVDEAQHQIESVMKEMEKNNG